MLAVEYRCRVVWSGSAVFQPERRCSATIPCACPVAGGVFPEHQSDVALRREQPPSHPDAAEASLHVPSPERGPADGDSGDPPDGANGLSCCEVLLGVTARLRFSFVVSCLA